MPRMWLHFELTIMRDIKKTPLNEYLVRSLPKVTWHFKLVTMKWHIRSHLSTLEAVCPGKRFCENIDCSICTSVLFKPECWPMGTIFLVVLLLCGIIALISSWSYLLLYVPMTIGKPVLTMFQGALLFIRLTVILLRSCLRCIAHRFACKTQ